MSKERDEAMLEYLFDFIENNILLIFIVVLILGVASVYSKGVKFLFFSLLGLAALYFGLLCLYRLGIGIEKIYVWSSKYVIMLCNQLDYYNFICLSHFDILAKVIEVSVQNTVLDSILYLIYFSAVISCVAVAVFIFIPKIVYTKQKKIKINHDILNKNTEIPNTINKSHPKFILNLVLRC